MKFDKWTVGLAAAGVVSLGSAAVADESPVTTLLSGTTISGYVDTSAIYKPGVQAAANRFVSTAPSTWNGFNFNVAALSIAKPLDEDQWSAGYGADLWFGPQAVGLPGAFGANGIAGDNFGVKQAYVSLRAPIGNGLDFKIGQIDTIIGYEVLDSYANPTYSRSFGFNIEPFSHTGITATYQVTEWLSVVGGIADSAFNGTNQKTTYYNGGGKVGNSGNGTLTYMGAVSLKAPDSWGTLAGSSLYAGIVDNGQLGPNSINYYVGLSVPTPIEQVTLGAAWDYYDAGDSSYATALAGYISWQIGEKLKLNTRVEWAKSDGNPWALGPGYGDPLLAPAYGYTEGSVYDGRTELFAVTAALDYSLWANVITRIEVIWDHDLTGSKLFSSEYIGTAPDGEIVNGRNNSVTLAANIIYKF
ncbi:MAG: outer membrane beta-barrel protein [Verrucomicrobiae bacterium]|nr:outer membrane beta-barrel protein [Verrucomicrobiae bacterium]